MVPQLRRRGLSPPPDDMPPPPRIPPPVYIRLLLPAPGMAWSGLEAMPAVGIDWLEAESAVPPLVAPTAPGIVLLSPGLGSLLPLVALGGFLFAIAILQLSGVTRSASSEALFERLQQVAVMTMILEYDSMNGLSLQPLYARLGGMVASAQRPMAAHSVALPPGVAAIAMHAGRTDSLGTRSARWHHDSHASGQPQYRPIGASWPRLSCPTRDRTPCRDPNGPAALRMPMPGSPWRGRRRIRESGGPTRSARPGRDRCG